MHLPFLPALPLIRPAGHLLPVRTGRRTYAALSPTQSGHVPSPRFYGERARVRGSFANTKRRAAQ
jgi:hypothetical protein